MTAHGVSQQNLPQFKHQPRHLQPPKLSLRAGEVLRVGFLLDQVRVRRLVRQHLVPLAMSQSLNNLTQLQRHQFKSRLPRVLERSWLIPLAIAQPNNNQPRKNALRIDRKIGGTQNLSAGMSLGQRNRERIRPHPL
jgi:hypothetical protein